MLPLTFIYAVILGAKLAGFFLYVMIIAVKERVSYKMQGPIFCHDVEQCVVLFAVEELCGREL